MRRIRILDEAAEEAIEAAAWYESKSPGLGEDFERATYTALDLLEEEIVPLTVLAGSHGGRVKRLMLKRFPYDVVVTETPDEIVVVAFAHQSRRPGYWRKRLRT